MNKFKIQPYDIGPILSDMAQELMRKLLAKQEESILAWIGKYGFNLQDVIDGRCEIERVQQSGNHTETLYILKKDGEHLAGMMEKTSTIYNIKNYSGHTLNYDLSYAEVMPVGGRIKYTFGG